GRYGSSWHAPKRLGSAESGISVSRPRSTRNASASSRVSSARSGVSRHAARLASSSIEMLGIVARGMRAEALKGHLDALILAVLAHGPSHGYAIIEELKRRSAGAFSLPEGTVYPALHRLERAGFLVSSWSESGGRKRRVYRLTGEGRRELDVRRREWRS